MIPKEHWERYLDEIYLEYQKDANPLLLLDALKVSWWGKLPLPAWAHEVMGFAAQKYLRSDGDTPFDDFLGLNAKRGRDNHPLKKRISKKFRSEVAYRVAEANKRYGFTLPVACWLISKTGVYGQYHSCDRIKDIYKAGEKDVSFNKDYSSRAMNFSTFEDYGYFDAISSCEEELQRLGLYESARESIIEMLKGGK